jgi:hypothetical protein
MSKDMHQATINTKHKAKPNKKNLNACLTLCRYVTTLVMALEINQKKKTLLENSNCHWPIFWTNSKIVR